MGSFRSGRREIGIENGELLLERPRLRMPDGCGILDHFQVKEPILIISRTRMGILSVGRRTTTGLVLQSFCVLELLPLAKILHSCRGRSWIHGKNW